MLIRMLTPVHLDALGELSNVGVGHAATALSQMLGRRIAIRIPRVAVTPFGAVADALGGPEALVAAVGLRVLGDALGHVLLILPRDAAEQLAGALISRPGEAADLGQALSCSALREVGNILACAYLNAVGRLTGLVLLPSVSSFTCDMAGAVVDAALIEQGEGGDLALVMETAFDVEGEALAGRLLFLPHPESLPRIFEAVRVAL